MLGVFVHSACGLVLRNALLPLPIFTLPTHVCLHCTATVFTCTRCQFITAEKFAFNAPVSAESTDAATEDLSTGTHEGDRFASTSAVPRVETAAGVFVSGVVGDAVAEAAAECVRQSNDGHDDDIPANADTDDDGADTADNGISVAQPDVVLRHPPRPVSPSDLPISPAKAGNSRPIDIVKKGMSAVYMGSPAEHSPDSCGSWNLLSGSLLSLHSVEGVTSGSSPARLSELRAQSDNPSDECGDVAPVAKAPAVNYAQRTPLAVPRHRSNLVQLDDNGGDGAHAAEEGEDVFDDTSALLIDGDDFDEDGGSSPHQDGRSTSGYASSEGDSDECADDSTAAGAESSSCRVASSPDGAASDDMTCTCVECVALAGGKTKTSAPVGGTGHLRAERLLGLRSLFLPMYRRCTPECDEGATGWGGRWMVEMSKLLPGGAH